LCVLAVVSIAVPRAEAADRPIRLRARTFVPAANVLLASVTKTQASRSAKRHFLVQFQDQITPAALSALRAQGAIPLRIVPERAVAIVAPSDFDPATVPGARWIGRLDPDDKVSGETRKDIRSPLSPHPFTIIEFHPDTTADAALNFARDAGATAVRVDGLPPHMIVVQTDRTAILALAQLDAVAWIFPASRQLMSGQAGAFCAGLVRDGGIVASYATEGEGWDGPGRNPAQLGYILVAASSDLSPSLQMAELSRAMDEWSRYVAVDWTPASRAGTTRTVEFLWGPTNHGDGYPFSPGVLAHTFYPAPPSAEPIAGDVHFNDELTWGASQPGKYDVFSTGLHELGHALGLNHSSDPDSVMYPSYQGFLTGLSPSDIESIRALYATRDLSGLPSQWTSGDVGTVATRGSVSFSGATVTINAAGADIWDTADEFTFTSEPLAGDGDTIARLDSLDAVQRWTKAGVMIRDGRSANAAHAFMLVSAGKGIAFQRRRGSGALSIGGESAPGVAPKWLRLARRGDRFEAYASDDGETWQLIGVDTIKMGDIVEAGLAVTSHDESTLAKAVFSNVEVDVVPRWTAADIGSTGLAGSETIGADRIDVTGAGADVWSDGDAFRFVWRPMSGDGEIVARVSSLEAVRAWTKAGVMIRDSRDSTAAHAFMLVSAGKGLAFQRRLTDGGESVSTSGGAGAAPAWVKLTRRGDTFSAYACVNGEAWRLIGTETIVMGRDVLAGLAVSSHAETARARAVFDAVQVK
jgi:hypothetical protein